MNKRIAKKISRRGTKELKLYLHPGDEKPKKAGRYLTFNSFYCCDYFMVLEFSKKQGLWNVDDEATPEEAQRTSIKVEGWAELPKRVILDEK